MTWWKKKKLLEKLDKEITETPSAYEVLKAAGECDDVPEEAPTPEGKERLQYLQELAEYVQCERDKILKPPK